MKSFAKILVAGAVAASVSLSAMAGSHSKITVGYITKSATNAAGPLFLIQTVLLYRLCGLPLNLVL